MKTMLTTIAVVALASCGWDAQDITFNDELYESALEYFDVNTGEPCVPDPDTLILGSGDNGGDTAQGVPTTSPDEDRQGGDDNQ